MAVPDDEPLLTRGLVTCEVRIQHTNGKEVIVRLTLPLQRQLRVLMPPRRIYPRDEVGAVPHARQESRLSRIHVIWTRFDRKGRAQSNSVKLLNTEAQ